MLRISRNFVALSSRDREIELFFFVEVGARIIIVGVSRVHQSSRFHGCCAGMVGGNQRDNERSAREMVYRSV